MESNGKYVAFLRGINVGGHHKVPMTDLQTALKKIDLKNIATLLNSGNILFESDGTNLENTISSHLEKVFGFPIPTILRESAMIIEMLHEDPFKNVVISKDIRLYVSFLKNDVTAKLSLPWKNEDMSYEMIKKSGNNVFNVLDVSISKTPEAMKFLEKYYGKNITTRNWNTILEIGKKIISHQHL